jgi:hypothetical protein
VVRALQHASPAQGFGISVTARVLKPSNRNLILSGFYGATPARSSLAKAFIFAATSLGRHARLPLSASVFFIDSAAWLASSQVWQR